jgi:hypothetical protein
VDPARPASQKGACTESYSTMKTNRSLNLNEMINVCLGKGPGIYIELPHFHPDPWVNYTVNQTT